VFELHLEAAPKLLTIDLSPIDTKRGADLVGFIG
jgi:hypothetical protein